MLRASHIYLMLLGLALACESPRPACDGCSVVGVAAVREPPSVFPPLVFETVGRDISDRVYERLAEFDAGGATIDTAAFRPALASSWERVDSLTLALSSSARRALARQRLGHGRRRRLLLRGVHRHDARDGGRVRARRRRRRGGGLGDGAWCAFRRQSPEQLYDATWHVRILPEHIWTSMPPRRSGRGIPHSHIWWAADRTG